MRNIVCHMPKFLIICRRSSPLALQASQDVFKDDVTVKHYAVPGKISIQGMVWDGPHFHQGVRFCLEYHILTMVGYLWTNTSKNHGLVIRLPVCFTIFPTRGSYKLGCPPFLETPINNCGRCSLRVFFLIKFPHWLGTDLITMASLSSPRGKLDKIAYHWTSLPLLNHQNLIKFTKEFNF